MKNSFARDCVATTPTPMPIRFAWDREDPYAITLTFPQGPDTEHPWIISRELLEWGLKAPSGIGDVRFASEGWGFTVTLMPHREGDAPVSLRLVRSWVVKFLADARFDPDKYLAGLDSALEQLLDEAA